ncbi:GNAT family N-acetyltransferase [Cloacibacillus evryensis]|uniref:GNAT family N-acetyltransferase n=2 Tax=Cloacibacillus evryensis TaxID=508460 RepID=UPI0026DF11B1|nr:GNAT family N-acetyltransferase [Cloacibacillus evryensis]
MSWFLLQMRNKPLEKTTPVLCGYGIRLRPVTISDAEFILDIRNMPHVKGKVGNLNLTVEQERSWLSQNIADPLDYFFIVESLSSVRLGTIGVYNIDFETLTAESGRIVIIPGSLAALPACILLNEFCFQQLNIKKLIGWVVSSNIEVISFNQQLGYAITHTAHKELQSKAQEVGTTHLELTKIKWQRQKEKLIKIATNGMRFQIT